MAIQYLDGIRLYRSLTAGLKRVVSRQDYLNRINVFPVPDSDTGTNMAYTLSSIEDGVQNTVYSDIHKMSLAIADSALDSARGNSGAILAQFFVGFSDALHDKSKLDTTQFAEAAQVAKSYAYEALVKPQEGTILTVIHDWANTLSTLAKDTFDFLFLMSGALVKANQSLNRTPEQLDVLAKAGVVDAGAQGFVDMLEGIQDYLDTGKISKVELKLKPEGYNNFARVNEQFKYCTECLIEGEKIHRRNLKERLIDLGNSIVLAGTKSKVKVHIHTNDPQKVFSICGELGMVRDEKADDMFQQQKDAHQAHRSIAVIVDSGCDLPEDIQEKMNIHMIPVRLNFGNAHYVDKVSLNNEEFWKELKTNPVHPKTSQPSPGDFRRQYQFLSTHYDSAVSIHLPGILSGTLQSAITATKSLPEFPIHVFDGMSGSVGLGLIAMQVAEAVQEGKTDEEVKQITQQAIANTSIFIGLDTLDNVVKGGRVSPTVKKIANFFRLNPILTFSETGVTSIGKTFGNSNKAEKFRTYVEKSLPENRHIKIGIGHALNESFAKKWVEDLQLRYGKENVFLTEIGPALGVHAGPKALVAGIQLLEDTHRDE